MSPTPYAISPSVVPNIYSPTGDIDDVCKELPPVCKVNTTNITVLTAAVSTPGPTTSFPSNTSAPLQIPEQVCNVSVTNHGDIVELQVTGVKASLENVSTVEIEDVDVTVTTGGDGGDDVITLDNITGNLTVTLSLSEEQQQQQAWMGPISY